MSLYKFQQHTKVDTKSYTLSDSSPKSTGNLQKTAENLLVHIPGEATGFYLLAAAYLGNVGISPNERLILFILSLVLLFLVRILAKASVPVIISSAVAFIIWMFIIPNGAFSDISIISMPWKLIVAAFYSAVVTILANSGKLK